ncbi:hypothetical protein TBR22_A05330 [Luteitalea sp. TBR-22]|uniref:PilZ domain-containing protein n=1 Tax=Luteitalea sp. TBR-22 TaxID=2802971 RepID=UPI001AF8C0C2|nr:PilZ domain-containing protein [Luteitalea sp. TBR-22]BCS31333.1 hypothetical protein TBR22_A05330 [Luteitalea sp. TBR-22]
MATPPVPQPYSGPERRAHPRIPAAAVPHLTAMVAGGAPVRLLDLSKRGVQIETSVHMRPGATVRIRFVSGDSATTLTGAVVRCTSAVIEEAGEVTYHTGLAFTDEISLGAEEIGAATHAAADPPPHADDPADDYTMIVMDGRTAEGPRHRTLAEW